MTPRTVVDDLFEVEQESLGGRSVLANVADIGPVGAPTGPFLLPR